MRRSIVINRKPEIAGYPDSGQLAATVGSWKEPVLREFYKRDNQVDYFEGE